MTKIKNPKQSAVDPLSADLDIVIWNLFGPILRSGGVCNLRFGFHSMQVIMQSNDLI